jgi:CHAD domain-containing protein
LKPSLLRPVYSWSIEDRHEIRIFLRKLRLFIWLFNKTKLQLSESKKINRLDTLSKDLLNCCGKIRDLDVLLALLSFYKIENPTVHKSLKTRRILEIKNFSKKWPLKKRTILSKDIQWFYIFIEKKNIISKKLLKNTTHRLFNNLKSSDPQTKKEWHSFRRKLRRLTNLIKLREKKNKRLIQFQKILGSLHDIENLRKIVKLNKPFPRSSLGQLSQLKKKLLTKS